ncbi:MAG: DNA photolyase [Deltaproteobacteria bacterium]|nr:DNA photolyase [Deltaproteobacteria bacterium]
MGKMSRVIKSPKRIFVHESVWNSPVVENLRKNLPEASFHVLDFQNRENFTFFPYDLEVVDFKGRFIRSCPATKFYHCCGYVILHFGELCSIGCTYCILQAYWNQPCLRIFGNTDRMLRELQDFLDHHPDTLFRIGTGEFTDSLLLDPWTGFSEIIVPFFARQKNAILELKTKTSFVDRLLELPHDGHTIVAWSLNAPSISQKEEGKAAPLEVRLQMAKKCAERGYFLAFHFDPLFYFPGWEEEYSHTIDRLFSYVPSDQIVYISLGAFRFMPELKEIILIKRPQWKYASGEFVPCPDRKRRYFKGIRIKLYKHIASRIRRHAPDVCVYLCMENGTVWKQSLGFHPSEQGGLPSMLDLAVKKCMKVGLHCSRSAAPLLLQKPQPYSSDVFTLSKII